MEQQAFFYHKNLTEYFKNQIKTWNWFKDAKVQAEQLKKQRTELLKKTYRLTPESEPKLYELVEQAKQKLGIDKKVTLYQELDSVYVNARVSFYEDEIDIVFSGDILKRLHEQELLSVIAHELSHILFFQMQSGEFEVTNRIVHSIANDVNSPQTMIETARLYRLYIELFCDRGSYVVTENIDTVIEALVKVSSGLENVSAKDYLKQAHEIFKEDMGGTSQITHPESFIRARALEIFKNEEPEELINDIIDARWGMEKLDVFKQQLLNEHSLEFLQLICKPNWMRTDSIFTLARQYFPDFNYSNSIVIDEDMVELFDQVDDSIREYFSYILLDFSTADSSLEDLPLGHAFQIAEQFSFHKTFRQLLKNELKLTVKKLDAKIKKAVVAVSEMSENEQESITEDN